MRKTIEALGEEGGGAEVRGEAFGDGEDLSGFGVADFFGGAPDAVEDAEPLEGETFAAPQGFGCKERSPHCGHKFL